MRFSIRDLLWLTLVVALAMSWFLHTQKLNSVIRRQNTEQLATVSKKLQLEFEVKNYESLQNHYEKVFRELRENRGWLPSGPPPFIIGSKEEK